MANIIDIKTALDSCRAQLVQDLSQSDFDELTRASEALFEQGKLVPANSREESSLTEQMVQLVRRYPAAAEVLSKSSPNLLNSPAAPPSQSGTPTPATPGTDGQPQAANPSFSGPTPVAGGQPPEPAPRDGQQPAGAGWTPEMKVQAFKEGITAVIGLVLIGATVWLAVLAVNAAGNDTAADVEHILTLILGLSGVVLGYYFGRVPAEAQATQARRESDVAKAGAADVAAKAEALVAAVDKADTAGLTRGTSLDGAARDQIRRLRDELQRSLHVTLR